MTLSPFLSVYDQPRSVDGLVSDIFTVYKRSWQTLITVMVLAVIPYGIFLVLLYQVVNQLTPYLSSIGASTPPSALPGVLLSLVPLGVGLAVLGVLAGLGTLVGQAGAITAVEQTVRNEPLSAGSALAHGLARLPAIIGNAILQVLAIMLITLACIPLLALTAIALFGILPLVALIVWAVNPGSRRPWLKWFIILTSPFGLLFYFALRWSLCLIAIVLERAGPVQAFHRSTQLVKGCWFRMLAFYLIAGIVGGTVASSLNGVSTLAALSPQTATVLPAIAGMLTQIIITPLSAAMLVLLFFDLQVRHRVPPSTTPIASDLAER